MITTILGPSSCIDEVVLPAERFILAGIMLAIFKISCASLCCRKNIRSLVDIFSFHTRA